MAGEIRPFGTFGQKLDALWVGAGPDLHLATGCGHVGIAHMPTERHTRRMTIQDFRPVAEVAADSRARIAVGKAGVHDGDRFSVQVNGDGQILLTPLASIPKRELIVWENPELLASVMRGLQQAADGNVSKLDWLDLDEDDDDE